MDEKTELDEERPTNFSQVTTKTMEEKPSPYRPTLTYRVVEIVILSISTVVLVAGILVSSLGNVENPRGRFDSNNSRNGVDTYNSQINPAPWTFSVWGLIYLLQVLWIIYAWSFVFRPSFPRTISLVTYIFYSIANIMGIIWIFVWGDGYAQAAFPIIALFAIALYSTIVAQAIFLYKQTPALKMKKKYKIDLYITRFLVLNSIAIYASWLTAATQLNFVIVLQYFANIDGTTAGTVGLSIVTVEIIIYFILENTILDRFARFIFIVYPLFILAFSGIVAANWGIETEVRNSIFSLVLLVLSVVLFIVRIVLWIVFAFVRPLPEPKKSVN